MYRLHVKAHFDAAHYIKDYQGKCSRMHGHRWGVEVVLEGSKLGPMNMLVDFSWVKKRLEGLLGDLDHYVVNERLPKLTQYGEADNVTAEYLAKWIYCCFEAFMIHPDVSERETFGGRLYLKGNGVYEWSGVTLVSVAVWESPDCCVEYYGEKA